LKKLTGKPYGEALKERITSKIGLRDTYIATGNIDVNKNEALTYMNLGGAWKQTGETHPSLLFSAGAIVSTPNDLAKFIQALFDLKLISQESLASMKTMRDGEGMGMEMEPFHIRRQDVLRAHGRSRQLWSVAGLLPEEKLGSRLHNERKVYPVGNIGARRCRHLLQ